MGEPGGQPRFVDHYALVGGSPETPFEELKRAYHRKLREFHPDRRPTSATGRGKKVTQALYDAWQVLQCPDRRLLYDEAWRRESLQVLAARDASDAGCPGKQQRSASFSPMAQADACRREGRALYKAAQAAGAEAYDRSTAAYLAAIAKFSEGISLAAEDHRLFTSRALCHMALQDWPHCREDAWRATILNRECAKGWFLFAKALAQEGSKAEALSVLEEAMRVVPANADLLELRAEISGQHSLRSRSACRLPSADSSSGSAAGPSRSSSKTLSFAKTWHAGSFPDLSRGGPLSKEPQRTGGKKRSPFFKLLPRRLGSVASTSPSTASTASGSGSGCDSRSRSRSSPASHGSSPGIASLPACVLTKGHKFCTCEFVQKELGQGSCSFCRHCESRFKGVMGQRQAMQD